MHLHGKQKQTKRLDIFQKFAASKHAFLFATDVAARGLDFPAVDWVLQLDAPEDADTYVHRVGRTARYERKGQSLLFLCPSEEEGMVAELKTKGIVVQPIKIKESKLASLENSLQKFAFQEPDIKYLAQRVSIHFYFIICSILPRFSDIRVICEIDLLTKEQVGIPSRQAAFGGICCLLGTSWYTSSQVL